MKIYTKTGDKGETSLLGGKRVAKNCIEMRAIGEVDELNAHIGVVAALIPEGADEIRDMVEIVQHKLFTIGANLAAVQTELVEVPGLFPGDIQKLESWIDSMDTELEPLRQFILPGGTHAAAQCLLARAVCRRAEREVVGLSHHYELPELLQRYLNRLSDALFVLGRYLNKSVGNADIAWRKDA